MDMKAERCCCRLVIEIDDSLIVTKIAAWELIIVDNVVMNVVQVLCCTDHKGTNLVVRRKLWWWW
jgi:hypothetical protein